MPIKLATLAINTAVVAHYAHTKLDTLRARREEKAYERMIAESQAKLAETILVPGHTNVYA